MSTTLGLDIGTNSIGWCLMEDGKHIRDIGVRIFPVGVNEDDYAKTGTEISKNASRRNARGIRRLYDRYKLRRKLLKKVLLELGMMPTEEMILKITSTDLYKLRKKAIDERISLKEIGRIFLLLNQRRGFKSNKKDTKTDEAKKEKSEMKLKMNELNKKVEESGCRTIGEYFYTLFLENNNIENWHNHYEPIEKIRTRFVYRKLYEIEFDLIWQTQNKFYPDILTDGNKNKIKNNCIFYQRPLKSQKHLVGKCRFEPNKRVAPKSSFLFQEFRIWQTINNLRVTYDDRYRSQLTLDEKIMLSDYLSISKEISQDKIKKLLGFPKSKQTVFNEMPDKIKGNTTNHKLIDAFGKEYFEVLDHKTKYKLWHTLFFANDEEWLYEYAINKLGLTKEQANSYVEVELEQDYSNISAKAITKILPLMKQGYDYAKACELAGYHHSYDDETDSKTRILDEKIQRNKGDDLKNPSVQQALSETYRLVNAIIAEHGKPDKIRVELAREMKKPKKIREKMKRANDDKRARRDAYIEFLKEKLKMKNVTKADILKFELWLELQFYENDLKKINSDINAEEFKKFAQGAKPSDNEKYRLYLECGRISPYTGKVINLEKLFSSEIEIEHIIPYSKSMDDSFINKTLCEREFNNEVGKQLKATWFNERPDKLHDFVERIKYFNDAKQERFTMEVIPDDFLNNQLTNNAYIAKEARKKLKTICRDVYISNGQTTSILRNIWELNKILNPDGKNEKSRDDHRHHAIDALVIANTTNENIRLLSTASHFDYTGRLKTDHFPIPYSSFTVDAEEKLKEILISYKNKKRLISKKKNKYIHSKKSNVQKTFSVRGALHEDTLYGQIQHPETKIPVYVIRKKVIDITTIKQVNKIVDKAIREIILNHIEANGGEKKVKEALKMPIYILSKDKKKKIPINCVRMIDPAENMIQLRPNENTKLYVSSGNNFCMAIYENKETGKRKYETISFFDAVKRKINKEPVVKQTIEDNKLLLTLSQNELVVVYENHPDEINWSNQTELSNRLYRFVKSDVNGNLTLGIHNLSNIKADKDKKPIVIRWTYNTFKGIKIKITTTGKIVKLS
ncbi:MAG: type II CRISPR RNA-guided endonuclease Cas9 [Ignavibacteria bacterium]|nr:type II CRISPR RNA-guided endonuclease Cas9 [Ignavibacteria bacterium]